MGIAAASAKAGAVVTALFFAQLNDAIGLNAVLEILAGMMALCALSTLLIPETKGRSLDEIEQENLYGTKEGDGSVEPNGDVSPVQEGRTNVHLLSGDDKEVEAV